MMFDDSQVVRLLTTITAGIPERRVILDDRRDVGIRRTIPEAMLPYKRRLHQELSPEQLEFNRVLGRNRILIENFFGQWRMPFRIIHGEFRGSKVLPRLSIPIAIALTNYHIKRHPLRRELLQGSRVGIDDEEEPDESTRVHRL
jgi:hypothetical protein